MGKEDEIVAAPPFEETQMSKEDTSDLEKHDPSALPQLKRKLKSRHLQMIAIGMPSPIPALHDSKAQRLTLC